MGGFFKRSLAAQALALCVAVGSLLLPPLESRAADALTPAEAHAIGVDAYVYFYSLITMDVTRRQMTNVEPGKSPMFGPANHIYSLPAYPPADMKTVVRPNFDTLYSSAWLDLKKEPVVVAVPDTHGRYYLWPMLDMWTDVFASPGWRTTGTGPQTYLVAPPGWTGDVPADMTRIDAPTMHVWIIGRIKTDGPPDYDAVHQIQAGLKVVPLSQWGKTRADEPFKLDPDVDMKTPPKLQVDHMTADKYFAYAAEILKTERPHLTDQPILAQLARLGFVPGQSFDMSKLDPAIQKALESVPADGLALMKWKVRSLARVVNGWSMNTDTMGVYGNYYLKRAIVSQLGLGANLPEDAIYPLNLADESGKPLDGESNYVIHFSKAELPPVAGFWSITLYDREGYQVANTLNRFAVSSWMPFVYNSDGSLDIYFQNESPGKDKEANWLPAPKGSFNLTMRLYAPESDALTGKWNPPAIVKTDEMPPVTAQ